MTRDELVRKLRDLRRLERRLRGGSSELWEQYFALEEGVKVRFPFAMLLVFDRASRERAFRDFLLALWASQLGVNAERPEEDEQLRAFLGVGAHADAQTVREAFRRMAHELHPDHGGDAEAMRDLIQRYRSSSYGGDRGGGGARRTPRPADA